MRTFGLIGYPLKHSFSPGFFKKKFQSEGIINSEYNLFPLTHINEIVDLVEEKQPLGLNVTIPYKEQVIPYIDELSPDAKKIGAVNTIKFRKDRSEGYNTDTYGFEVSLKNLYGKQKPTNALILGTGGAAKAVQFVLEELDIMYHNVSRRQGYFGYDDLDEGMMAAHQLIINTTPLGMSPNQAMCPNIPYQYLTKYHLLYDLVYNPEKTRFMELGAAQGSKVKNGLEMLHLQAEKSWEIWNDI